MFSSEPIEQPVQELRSQRPELTDEQKRHVLSAAAEYVRSATVAQPAELPDPSLGGAADQILAGAFVSLKRRGHLRSCCGGLIDRPIRLIDALRDASQRTALEDVRFPSLSPTELEHLDVEVWLLFNPQPIQGQGEERVEAVTVGGKHGLLVTRGDTRGILLPGVAVEHNWDSRQFLEQVCVKAGLHPTLWKDQGTALSTFEGEALRGRVLPTPPARKPVTGFFQPDELAAYVQFCRSNIALALSGATPNYYLPGVSDVNVSGVVLQVRRPASSHESNLCQVSLRPGLPLQSTLFALARAAAQTLYSQGIGAAEIDGIEAELLILYDPAMHGTVADPDLAGIEPAHRAVLVMEKSRTGILFDVECNVEELVSQAVKQASVSNPAATPVFSLKADATATRIAVAIGPKAVRGPAVRPPGVAGSFYPADPEALNSLVDDLLVGGETPQACAAALLPHAGLHYSGRIAAAVLRRIKIPETVIVLGPKHTSVGVEWAVAPHQTWSMPGFTVESDAKLARQLTQAITGLQLDSIAHQREHAIEVELPLLARLAPHACVVGIALGAADLAGCRRFARELAGFLRERQGRPLLLISSDMNHFATDAENRRLDEMALAALERLDPEEVYETVTGNHISMCGVVPAVIVLETLRLMGCLHSAERVGYATSADVSGDTTRVVGYAGMLFQ